MEQLKITTFGAGSSRGISRFVNVKGLTGTKFVVPGPADMFVSVRGIYYSFTEFSLLLC